MRRLAILGTVVALVAMALPGSALAAKPAAGTCSGGAIPGGTYSGFTVTGNCTIAAGASVQINGNLTVADGAILNDHAAAGFQGAQVHITGDVKVGKGAVLGLGSYATPGSVGLDTVGGNIVANQPLTLYLGSVTVGGNVISNGGGLLSTSAEDFRNFPVKDNTIHGNLIIQGWRGGWIGLIRNHVDGNVIFAKNVSLSNPETGPGTDGDSSEVMGSVLGPQVIGGNLICHGNVPAAQVNFGDGGDYNVVGGNKIGECAGL
jgi:hypothetical protein